MTEVWKPIPGWPYDASSGGRVRRQGTLHLMRAVTDPEGYQLVTLRSGLARKRTMRVHRLVLEAFVGSRPPGHQVNHKDANKGNNAPQNLEWVTAAENEAHAQQNGLKPRGVRHGSAKLAEDDVRAIRADGRPHGVIAVEYGLKSPGHVSAIKSRKYWRHIT